MPSHRTVAAALLSAALGGLGLLAAGCGGGSGPGVAAIGTTAATTDTTAPSQSQAPSGSSKEQAAFAFSKCMRANGVPKFPDPQTSGNAMRVSIGPGTGIDPNSPTFKAAQQKCQKLLPNGGQPSPQQIAKAEKQALDFSKCMRSHGVPKFPDPQFSTNGGFGVRIGARGSGLDPSSPTFQHAQQACAKNLPGLIKTQPPGASRSSGGNSGSATRGSP
jgi:hypothetical protein